MSLWMCPQCDRPWSDSVPADPPTGSIPERECVECVTSLVAGERAVEIGLHGARGDEVQYPGYERQRAPATFRGVPLEYVPRLDSEDLYPKVGGPICPDCGERATFVDLIRGHGCVPCVPSAPPSLWSRAWSWIKDRMWL